jgi:hypothetical protein
VVANGGLAADACGSCGSATACVAVGDSLNGAACRSPGARAAVGEYHNGTGLSLPLAEAWNGTAWTLQAAASPRGSNGSTLAGIAVGQAAGFTALGNQLNSAQVATLLAETGPGDRAG